MSLLKGFTNLVAVLAVILISGQAYAQSDTGADARVFGLGQPQSIQSLPPGQLRNRLESLPPQASSKALRWLQDFSFPEADLGTLQIDDEGGVFYGDTLLPDPEQLEESESAGPTLPADAPQATLDDAFFLHSRPGSSNVVFIDFDGATISGTAWNGTYSVLEAVPYNIEGDASTFSDNERRKIVDIWHRVAEDLAAYDIDVTTEEPTVFDSNTGTILITNTIDANGNAINCTSCGGVAYVGVFGRSNYHTYYSPALVFFNKLGGGHETYVSEASSHEFGHNLGLSHDGLSGASATTYYAGHGSGLVSWAPIMGNSYYNNVTEWSKGEYANANQSQDDLAIIDGKLGYRPDDHGNTRVAASTLAVDPDGSVFSSNPELDPHNVLTENKGVIGSSGDVDVFSFVSGAGSINLTVNPGWDAFYRSSSRRGSNLDIEAELQDQSGSTVALNDPNTNTNATISATVSAGTYYLLISGVGNAVTPYTDYASLGQYFISGSVPPAALDETGPTPDPMGWASPPVATSSSSITMTSTTAVDDISNVEYNFLCTIGGTGCVSSGWQPSATHTAAGLAAGTAYTFRVMARDFSGNQTAASVSATATTDTPPPYTNYGASGETPMAGTVSGSYSATLNDGGSIQSITERESGGKPANRHSYLEHRWNFNISQGATVTVYVNAWSSGSTDNDTFNFEYSLNNGNSFSPLSLNVSSQSAANLQSANISGAPSGSIIIRVVDTDQGSGNREKNTIYTDHLYIQVGNPSSDPPIGDPSGLTANAVSSSRIDLAWTDETENEAGFTVDRSLSGGTDTDVSWTQIADLSAGSTAYSDGTGLAAETTYYYRLRAHNTNGFTGYTYASETTHTEPTVTLSLSASGVKVKGKHQVDLSWSGSTQVKLYRDNALIGTANGSTYKDNIGTKGGASYRHKVCLASNTTVCSNITTTVF